MTSAVATREEVEWLKVRAKYRALRPATTKPKYPTPILRGAAQSLWTSQDHEAMIAGPSETGKTWAACHIQNYRAWKYPGMQGAIVRKTYASMHGSVLQTFRRILAECAKAGLPMPHAFGGEKPDWFDYPNGSRIFVGGMDNPDRVLSSERDSIYFNQAEEGSLDDWETLSTRTTGRGSTSEMGYSQLFGDCNPGPSTHWILSRDSLRLLHSRHEDNPTLYSDTGELTDQGKRTMAVLDTLTGTRYQRLRLGKWVGAEGLIYQEYDRDKHLIDPFPIPEDWPRFRTIDFGYTNPFVALWAAQDPDGRLYIYREYYMTQRLVEDWALDIVRASEGERYRFTVADHDAEGRGTLERRGISTLPARKDVSEGIQAVQARLRKQGDGKPRLFIFRDCRLNSPDPLLVDKHKPTSTAEEFDGYVWARVQHSDSSKEVPRKEDDHGMDALRYLCYELAGGSQRQSGGLVE